MKKIINFIEKNPEIYNEILKTDLNSINEIQKISSKYSEFPVKEILTQMRLRKKASKKFSHLENLLFTEKGIQQSSSKCLSEYHAVKFSKYKSLADICCGIGADLRNLSNNKQKVYAVDFDKSTLECTKWNNKDKTNITYILGKAQDFNENAEAVFIDPDRRINSKRMIDPEDYSPPISDIFQMLDKYPNMAIKLSPIIDYKTMKIPKNHTFEFVSENGELKEILLCFGELATEGIFKKAILLPENLEINNLEKDDIEISEIKKFLYEPDSAIIRAGLVKHLGYKLGFSLIDKHLALLTNDHPIKNRFGKTYKVITSFNYNLKALKRYLKENQIGILDIKTRGFSETVEEFRKKIKLKGSKKATMFILKMNDIHKIVIANSFLFQLTGNIISSVKLDSEEENERAKETFETTKELEKLSQKISSQIKKFKV